MESGVDELKALFSSGKTVSRQRLSLLFDQNRVPDEPCWRTVYRIIFDASLPFPVSGKADLDRRQLEPAVVHALKMIEHREFSETSLLGLMETYSRCCFGMSQTRIKEAIFELSKLTQEFKSIYRKRHQGVEQLEKKTIETVMSNLETEAMVQQIKSDFEMVLENFRTDFVRLDQISNTDYLTGLHNRRFFDEKLKSEVSQALKEKTWLNLIMIDIDDFKKFNDAYGHPIGDQALKAVALKIRATSEQYSSSLGIEFYPTRYGGEEFMVILPAIELQCAMDIGKAILDTIRDYSFVIRNTKGEITHKNIKITASIGIAEFRHAWGDQGMEKLISSADAAMYMAKQTGKNCVMVQQK